MRLRLRPDPSSIPQTRRCSSQTRVSIPGTRPCSSQTPISRPGMRPCSSQTPISIPRTRPCSSQTPISIPRTRPCSSQTPISIPGTRRCSSRTPVSIPGNRPRLESDRLSDRENPLYFVWLRNGSSIGADGDRGGVAPAGVGDSVVHASRNVRAALEVSRVVFLVRAIELAQDALRKAKRAAAFTVGRVVGVRVLRARRAEILPAELGSRSMRHRGSIRAARTRPCGATRIRRGRRPGC
jgi:hypothetical protein